MTTAHPTSLHMQPLSALGRAAVLLVLFSAPVAFAQDAPSPYIKSDGSSYEPGQLTPETSQEIDAAVNDAMRASSEAMATEPAPESLEDAIRELEAAVAAGEMTEEQAASELEGSMGGAMEGMATALSEAMGAMFGLTPEQMAEAEMTSSQSGTTSTNRLYRRRSVQTYPVIPDGYGMDGDGFPDRMTVSGTIVDAGSLRICRFDAPPVSRWLRIRLSSTSATYPGEQIIVAVQCHEDKKELLMGRSVRMEVWKSIIGNPIRMAKDNVPDMNTPMYESYPGNVRLGG